VARERGLTRVVKLEPADLIDLSEN
jgi:hypothetical protein